MIIFKQYTIIQNVCLSLPDYDNLFAHTNYSIRVHIPDQHATVLAHRHQLFVVGTVAHFRDCARMTLQGGGETKWVGHVTNHAHDTTGARTDHIPGVWPAVTHLFRRTSSAAFFGPTTSRAGPCRQWRAHCPSCWPWGGRARGCGVSSCGGV